MYIKTLTIQGFKSYRDQTQIEPFSPRHNVVVGRNGSGKSNFFAAIRFVLSDAYTTMGREERQALLHEGVSVTTTLSAFVEIIFDNSDNRFPTGREEVILRRTIGAKKDEYSLDKKSASKADVMNLLESAGFSKSNPYYIVPQGRITSLTNAKDHERLALLKEVAGTKVYEQRRTESLKIMAETEAKRSKINELIEYIESRLAELEEEKEELKEFQEKDKDRKCLEYAMHDRELKDVTKTLEQLEDDRKVELHGTNQRRELYNNRQKEMQQLERQINQAKLDLESLQLSRDNVQSELTDMAKSRTELQCIVEDLRAAGENAGSNRARLTKELNNITKQMSSKQAKLDKLLPKWEAQRGLETTEKRSLDEVRAKLEALYAKQGRGNRFSNKSERDQFLRREITSIKAFGTTQESELESTRAQLQTTKQSLNEIETRIAGTRQRMEDGKELVGKLQEEIGKLKDEQSVLTEKRKELWREDTKLDSLVAHAADELRSAEQRLASMMDKDTGSGLRAVDKIAERFKLDGVYGPLYRLFKLPDENFSIAVEQTAGNSLFHVVVDNDETASKVLDVMLKEKTGRVTFMPLNRLKPKPSNLPNAHDAIPLLDKLQFEPTHQKAFQQVFGKTCVCRDLTIAAAYVKSHGINTITLDGDKVDRKGALTGGYHDMRRSRLESIKSVTTWRTKWTQEESRSKEVKTEILKLEQEITQLTGKIQKLTSQQNQARDSRELTQREGSSLVTERDRLKENIEKLESEIADFETEVAGLKTKLTGYEQELGSPFVRGLTNEEEALIESLGKEVAARQKQLVEIGNTKNELGSEKNILEIELKESLSRRRDKLEKQIESIGQTDAGEGASSEDLEGRKRELRNLEKSVERLQKRLSTTEDQVEGKVADVAELQSQFDDIQNQQSEDSRSMARQQKNTERYHAKHAMLDNRKDECHRNIRDLGVLPEEAFEKYVKQPMDRLVQKLQKVNEGLKKFAHVNKKAFEQYNNFTKQRDQLLERREELDKSAQSIEELVEVLDQRKDEAIERTFKQVASNFEEVFEKLVPAGKGKLIIQRRIDQDDERVEDEGEETQQSSVDNYTGVSIKVSFNSKVDEGLRIQQLSGGQKSLVALATVFAIQKCDPAPFYLFDEIDANLDAQYRTAVASMIKSLAGTAQFITTTFRPEMLVTADKFYGVLFNTQKVSSIRAIKREEAMEFVDQEAQAH